MNEKAIKKLRLKFILASFISFLTVMLIMGALIFFLNLHGTVAQINTVLDYIVENNGNIPKRSDESSENEDNRPDTKKEDSINNIDDFFNYLFHIGIDSYPEFRYQTRYFAVIFDESGNVESIKTNNIAAVSDTEAEEYARKALNKKSKYGSFNNYYYKTAPNDSGYIVVCLDCSLSLENTRRLLNITLLLIIFGAITAFILVKVLSRRMIMPEVRNAERQKQFITNASHELKTPLAVIRANTELDMLTNGENDWNQSTLNQIDHMTGLIQNLITIARAEETPKKEELTDTDISRIVSEVTESFEPVAIQNGKTIEKNITEGIIIKASESKITQLVTILTDNAIKYCDDNGTIRTELSAKGKTVRLAVYNDYANGQNLDCSKFFERFYRADASHNINKGGYGIGLSIAESIVQSYKGTIKASWSNGVICFLCKLKTGS